MNETKKLNIAIIGSRGYPYVYGGYETFTKEISERLVKMNVGVTIYCHKNLFDTRPKQKNGINLVYIPSIETKTLSQLTHSFLATLHACIKQYDVLLYVNSANGIFGVFTKVFRIKTAINVDGLEWLRPKWKGFGSKYFYFASWLSTRWFDVIINDSEAMRNIYLDIFKKNSIVIAYGASVRKSINKELIQKWKLETLQYYLIVGRLIPDNNADIIVNGFIKSNSKRKLVIVGDVPYKDKYAEDIKKNAQIDDRIIFTGYVNDPNELAELYHNSFVYLHGHEFGGTNPTMLKAMAYGCSILALDTVFNREMLENGKFGIYFNKNIEHIKTQIELLDNDAEKVIKMKNDSIHGITKKYTWDFVTQKYFEVFKDLTKEN